tara:strand:- start:26016 stop:26270 length:255 start_codon:yes stop_codon:yes gene_type:complete
MATINKSADSADRRGSQGKGDLPRAGSEKGARDNSTFWARPTVFVPQWQKGLSSCCFAHCFPDRMEDLGDFTTCENCNCICDAL